MQGLGDGSSAQICLIVMGCSAASGEAYFDGGI